MKRTMLVLLLVSLFAAFSLPCQAEAPADTAGEAPVDLYVFLWDRCGGCGVDAPGCGECRDTERYHLSIKEQLGDEMYDGSVTYRMLNCRYEEFRVQFAVFSENYGVREDWLNVLPAVFIGRDGAGVYMIGEEAIGDIAEILHEYEETDDVEALQQMVFERWEQRAAAEGESEEETQDP